MELPPKQSVSERPDIYNAALSALKRTDGEEAPERGAILRNTQRLTPAAQRRVTRVASGARALR